MENNIDLFDIKISNLSNGTHNFKFEVDDAFFGDREDSLVQAGNLLADVELDKNNNTWKLHMTLNGTVQQTCDRCLNEIQCLLDGVFEVVLKSGELPGDDFSSEIEFIAPGAIKINVACYIYECLHLSLPLQVFCDKQLGNTCDEDVIAFLRGQKNSSSEKSFFEALKELRLKQ